MRKLFWMGVLISISSATFAQEINSKVSATSSCLPSQGDASFEVQFNPLSNTKNSFTIDALKLRYFMSDESALRVSLGLNIDSNKDFKEANEDSFDEDNFTKTVNNKWSLDLGYELHHSIAPRLDTYWGLGAGISKTSKKVTESEVGTDGTEESTAKSGNFSWNLGVFTGFDFYVYRGLYLGSELGLRYSMTKTGDTTYKADDFETTIENPDTDIDFGFYVTPSIRLGWTF